MESIMKILTSLCLLVSFNIQATTWADSEVDDPLSPGKKCKVSEPMSSGSYIYHWPSKYDQVFWPLTTSQGIWHCQDSGFIAFIGDFENITDDEKAAIKSFLQKRAQSTEEDSLTKLQLLESVYALRNTTAEFKNKLKRVLAYTYESKGEITTANEFRASALADINNALDTELEEFTKLEYLYLAANYERQLGNIAQSDNRLTELKAAIKNIKDEGLAGFAGYLSELLEHTSKIETGGILAPKKTK